MRIDFSSGTAQATIRRAMRNGNQFVKDKVKDTALMIERSAKQNATVDTGYMRNSVETILSDVQATVQANAEYSFYVEFGTSRKAPKPFFFPAVEEGKSWLMDELRRGGIL
jgi:HK97 gp10 family phage protein